MYSTAICFSIQVQAVDIIEAVYNYNDDPGQLLLVRIDSADSWKTWDITKNTFYSGTLDSASQCYKDNYDFFRKSEYILNKECNSEAPISPKDLVIQSCSQKKFPNGLFQLDIFSRLQNLRISDLQITEFQAELLTGANELQTLDLSFNKLEELPSKTFLSAGKLVEINLSYNRIATMPSDVFLGETDMIDSTTSHTYQPLIGLKTIRLNNNNLTFIDPNWFRYLRNLETITLNDNHLAEIDLNAAFRDKFALRSVYLQNNNFSRIFTGTFAKELDYFDASNNPNNNDLQPIRVNAKWFYISSTNSFQCYIPAKAVIVRADHNRIKTVIVEVVPNTKLQQLHLHHNEIDSANFLSELSSLQTINLSHNELTHLDPKVFANMRSLMMLDISHNKFTAIDLSFVESKAFFTRLDISHNQLSGQFNLSVVARALTTLNIASNNYTSVLQNLRQFAPNLFNINLNDNNFKCDDLDATISSLNSDRIKTVTPIEPTTIGDNVKGLRCWRNRKANNERIDDSLLQDSQNVISTE